MIVFLCESCIHCDTNLAKTTFICPIEDKRIFFDLMYNFNVCEKKREGYDVI